MTISKKLLSLPLVIVALPCLGMEPNHQLGDMAVTQYTWLSDQALSGRTLRKSEVLKHLGAEGDGAMIDHFGATPASGKSVWLTKVSYSKQSIPRNSWLDHFELTIVNGTDEVDDVDLYPKKGLCIKAIQFVQRFGLSKASSASPTEKGDYDMYIRSVGKALFTADVPYGQEAGSACISHISIGASK